jgi:hypothetical protein
MLKCGCGFWAVCLLAFELLLPPTRFSARLVSASWLVIFVHLVRGSGIVFISNHRAYLPAENDSRLLVATGHNPAQCSISRYTNSAS